MGGNVWSLKDTKTPNKAFIIRESCVTARIENIKRKQSCVTVTNDITQLITWNICLA